MSAQNDLINYQNIIKEANSLINEQINLWGGVVSSIKQVGKITPSSFVNAQKQVNQALEKSAELTEKQRLADIKLQKAREDAFDRYEKKLQAEAKALEKADQQRQKALATEQKAQALLARSENVYNKIQAKVNQLTQTYNNLAAKKELGLNLTDKELAQLNSLESRLNKYNGVLKQVDATIGKNQRNVGNYASGWNGLGNSINQITRELPAFTFSAQTGFLALSNNLPILADEIQRVSNNVKEMRAQGQQVPGVMSQILTSFLSWQTALSIGVTLITIYGKEIGEFFKQAFKGTSTMTALAESQKQYNEALQEGSKNAQKEIQELKVLVGVAQNTTLSTKQRTQAVKDLQDLYPDYFGNLTTEQVMNSDLTSITKELTNALMARAIAVASINKMTENASKILDLEENNRLEKERLTTLEKQAKTQAEITKQVLTTTTRDEAYTTGRLQTATSKVLDTKRKIAEADAEILRLNEINTRLSEKAQVNQAKGTITKGGSSSQTNVANQKDNSKELLKTEYELQVARINQMEDGTAKELELLQAWYEYQQKLHKDNAKELLITQLDYWSKLKKINDDAYKEENEAFIRSNDELEKEFEQWEKEYNEGYEAFLKSRQEWKDKADEEYLKSEAEKDEKFIQQLQKTRDYLEKATDLNIFGFGSLNIFTQLEENGKTAFENMLENAQDFKEKFAVITNAVGDILKDVLGQMEERQNAYFQQQFANLETEKDLALQFAGENTAGREAIEKQYEEKKRALQMQQAKQQKQMAMMQATINIAQGITSALAQAPPYSFILAGLVGVLGAVQLAKIASSPLPQFYTGTSNAPEGLALTQERGAEMITDKHGNIKTLGNNKGAQLTYLNKGDKVFTADETTQKLNELLISSGVSPIVNVSGGNGMSKEDMREVLNDTLAKQPKNSIIFDENGIKAFTSKENRRTILKNRNVRI